MKTYRDVESSILNITSIGPVNNTVNLVITMHSCILHNQGLTTLSGLKSLDKLPLLFK